MYRFNVDVVALRIADDRSWRMAISPWRRLLEPRQQRLGITGY